MLVNASTIQDIDRSINRFRSQIVALEQAKSVLTTAEPMNASTATNTNTAPAKRRGRPRKAGTQTRSASVQRGPGRPKGKRGPGRPKGSRNKPKDQPMTPATPEVAKEPLWGNEVPAQ